MEMKEFTKEDLIALYKCVRLAEIQFGDTHTLDTLKYKLQSIINRH